MDVQEIAETEDQESVSEQLSKIKGDAIGDTLYSERWVLRALIKLSNVSEDTWDADLEQDLCLLWDMTTEKDVVSFLLQNDIFNLFCKVLSVINHARCIEILTGILGNMCCVAAARDALAAHNASFRVVNLITSEDSLVLVQVVRLLNSCLWCLRVETPDAPTRSNSPLFTCPDVVRPDQDSGPVVAETGLSQPKSPWLEVVEPHKELLLRHLGFFLSSAINEDLLCSSLNLIETLLAIPALALARPASEARELAAGLAECLRQLLRGLSVGDSVTANRRLWRALQVWMGLVGQVASCHQGRINLGATGDVLTKCFTKLVLLMTTPEALRTQEPEMATLCLSVLETLPEVNVSATVLARLTQVLCNLEQDLEELMQDPGGSLEVENLLHRGNQFLKQRIDDCDDLVALLEHLNPHHQAYLVSLAEHDEDLARKLEGGLLQIRTNGLVQ